MGRSQARQSQGFGLLKSLLLFAGTLACSEHGGLVWTDVPQNAAGSAHAVRARVSYYDTSSHSVDPDAARSKHASVNASHAFFLRSGHSFDTGSPGGTVGRRKNHAGFFIRRSAIRIRPAASAASAQSGIGPSPPVSEDCVIAHVCAVKVPSVQDVVVPLTV
jgi:hypothetical protein